MNGKAKTAEAGATVVAGAASAETGGAIAGLLRLNRRTVITGLLVLVGYYLGSKLGFALTFQPHPVSVMWPPNSILLAALLLSPVRSWWFLLLCAFPAHLAAEMQSKVPPGMILCWFVSNSCEALIGAAGTRWLTGAPIRLERMQSIGALILCGVLLGPFLSSFLDAAFVSLNHFGQQGYWQVWTMRFCSNVFTALTLVPVIVTWGSAPPELFRALQPLRAFEASIAFLGLLAVNVLVFVWEGNGPTSNPAWLYAPLPFLLWAAVRFGVGGTSTGILSVAILAIWGAVHGRGPFTSHSPEQNAFAIQIFFGVISTPLLFLAASIAERRKAEDRFTRVFRSSPDAMLITRLKDRRIIDVNERWEHMLGHRREESIGRTMSELNIFATPADGARLTAGISSGQRLYELEVCLCTRVGELRHALISADSDDIAGERCIIKVIRDITDRKRAEEAQQNLAHVSRLAVVGELTAMVAHEVNQPLGAILSNADAAEILLQSENPPLDEIRQILADIRKNDLRADEAIRRIRALLRKREMQMQALDLNETVVDVLRLVAGDVLRRRVQVQRQLATNLPLVLGDRVHLQQVLLNLIVNGMDAMEETSEHSRMLTLETKRNGDGQAEVMVGDCGHGVPPQKLARIFDSFFTTKHEGMGLGLSIARSIIEAHRGRIWAENNPGGGTTLRFTVPIASSTGQPTAQPLG